MKQFRYMLFLLRAAFGELIETGYNPLAIGDMSQVHEQDIEATRIELGNIVDGNFYYGSGLAAFLYYLNTTFSSAHDLQGTFNKKGNQLYYTNPEKFSHGLVTFRYRIVQAPAGLQLR